MIGDTHIQSLSPTLVIGDKHIQLFTSSYEWGQTHPFTNNQQKWLGTNTSGITNTNFWFDLENILLFTNFMWRVFSSHFKRYYSSSSIANALSIFSLSSRWSLAHRVLSIHNNVSLLLEIVAQNSIILKWFPFDAEEIDLKE